MINISKERITAKYMKIQQKIDNFVEYLNMVSTNASIERYVDVMSVINKRRFIIDHQYNKIINLINKTV
jgi:hypothetical protein